MTILYIWLRAVALIVSILILFGCGAFLVDSLRWLLALGRSRIVRIDLRRSRSTRSTDHRLGTQAAPACDGGAEDRGTTPAQVLHFDRGYTSDRRQLTALDDRWRRLELEGLALPPLDAGERLVR